jgi:hypothetical protein
MTKPRDKIVKPVPEHNQSHKEAGGAPSFPLDTTKGHRDDEKKNAREQATDGNLTQNTSHSGRGDIGDGCVSSAAMLPAGQPAR